MLQQMYGRLLAVHADTRRFLLAVAAFAFGGAILNAIFNNLLSDRYHIDGLQRTLLEIPRELPGLLVVFVTALFVFLPTRRLAVLSCLAAAAGLVGMASLSPSFLALTPWLFLFSLGQHLLLPIQSAVTMELSRAGETGRRLGQLNALSNVAVIAGSALVYLAFRWLNLGFSFALLLAGISFVLAATLFYRMQPGTPHPQGLLLRLHRPYRVYYLLCVLFGTRKQIFLTFAPWVLVSLYEQPTARLAQLLTLGAALGIVIQPAIGRLVDRKGERCVLALEALLLVPVCLGYALARDLLSPKAALATVCICFLADQALMGFGMARSTWLKKIAIDPAHVTPTLTMAVTIDHVFSVSLALLGGLLWRAVGYQAVFYGGAAIALVNLIVVLLGMKRAEASRSPMPPAGSPQRE